MRCCPVCYEKAHLNMARTSQTGSVFTIEYRIICPTCKLSFRKTGNVTIKYNSETMQPEANDSDLKSLIYDWDSILRDPEKERIANI